MAGGGPPPDVLKPPPAVPPFTADLLKDDDHRLYEFLVTIHHGVVKPRSAASKAQWTYALKSRPTQNAQTFQGCRDQNCQHLILPVGVPAEAMRWLSLTDYFWRTNKTPQMHQSMNRLGGSAYKGRDSLQIIRETLDFNPSKSVRCSARRKVYWDMAKPYDDPADKLVNEVRRSKGIMASQWPVPAPTNDAGHILARLTRTETGQYRLYIHWFSGIDLTLNGAAMDWALSCESPGPLRSEELGTFKHTILNTSAQRAMVTKFEPESNPSESHRTAQSRP